VLGSAAKSQTGTRSVVVSLVQAGGRTTEITEITGRMTAFSVRWARCARWLISSWPSTARSGTLDRSVSAATICRVRTVTGHRLLLYSPRL